MRSHAPAWAVLLIVSGLSGCDNVIWGGADIDVVPPPPRLAADTTGPETLADFGLPRGPVLFHLAQVEGQWQLIPVAELGEEGLRTIRPPEDVGEEDYQNRFRQTVVPVGAQFDVFRRGARVGTFTAQADGPPTQCGVPTVYGNTTVVAAAVDASDFIAFRNGLAPAVRGEFTPPQVTGPIRTYASIVAERLILQAGLPRPRSWAGAQRDLQPIDVVPGGHPEMAATYLVGDTLGVGPGQLDGYSVFYIADYTTQRGYMPVYSEVRNYGQTGKIAPRLIDYVDWNGDDSPEVLVQLYGRETSWYEAIANRGGEWEQVWEAEPRCARN